MTTDIQQQVTDTIIAAIEAGAGSWQMPWHRGQQTKAGAVIRPAMMPQNARTNAFYQGANVLMLWGAGHAFGYESQRWATYKQWGELGAQVRKGEKGSLIAFWKSVGITDRTTGEPVRDASGKQRQTLFARPSVVFNAAQVDGYSEPVVAAPVAQPVIVGGFDARPDLEAFIAATSADFRDGGDAAFYVPSQDFIQMPDRSRFVGTPTSTAGEAYYSTALHELTHWTGHKARLDRDLSGRFGDEKYAGEELVAELGAAFLCAQLGVTNAPRADHAKYIANWLKALRNDKRAIFTAASAASKAAAYLIGAAQEEVKQAA